MTIVVIVSCLSCLLISVSRVRENFGCPKPKSSYLKSFAQNLKLKNNQAIQ